MTMVLYEANPPAAQLKSLNGIPTTISEPRIHIFAVALNYLDECQTRQLKAIEDITHLKSFIAPFKFIKFASLCGHSATSTNIIHQFGDLLRLCVKGDIFILYLAGHGSRTDDDWGYAFEAYGNGLSVPTLLTHQTILRHIKKNCPPGVFVLQIRDTCAASPSKQERDEILSDPQLSTIVLAACDSAEPSWEYRSKPPHSVFLRQIINTLSERTPMDVGKVIEKMVAKISTKHISQTPRLEPRQCVSKLVEVVTRLVNQLRGSRTSPSDTTIPDVKASPVHAK